MYPSQSSQAVKVFAYDHYYILVCFGCQNSLGDYQNDLYLLFLSAFLFSFQQFPIYIFRPPIYLFLQYILYKS